MKTKAVKTLQKFKDDNKMHQSSKYERKFLSKLEEEFGSENVIYQHFDSEIYPYSCDFYIKSLDLWLELNGWWHHGNHPFFGSEDDIKTLSDVKLKYPNQYASFEKVWTKSDVLKFDTAKRNKINYLAIYDNGFAYNSDKICIFKFKSLYSYNEIINYLKEKLEENNGKAN